MLLDTKSLFSLRSWLFYAEVLVVVGFVVLASLYIRRGSADPESPTRSTLGDLIERADNHFARQDFVNALLFYWRALLALEKAGEQQVVSVKGAPQSITRVRLHTNLRIAEIYSQTNWPKDAKARLEHAARIQPDHVDVRLLRGKLLRDEGLDDDLLVQATEEFLAVIEKNPHNAEAHYLLGILYQGNQQLEEAVEHYKKAIENDPELRSIASEKAPIGILARLQLSRTYSKMLQKYRFLDREYTNEDLAEVSRL